MYIFIIRNFKLNFYFSKNIIHFCNFFLLMGGYHRDGFVKITIWFFGKKFPAFRAWRRSFFRACHRFYAPFLFALRRRTDRNTFRSCEQQRLGKHKAFADLVPVLGADRASLHKRALSRLCRGKNRLAMFFMRGAYRLLLRCRLVSSKPRGSFYARLSLFFSCICAKLFPAFRQV